MGAFKYRYRKYLQLIILVVVLVVNVKLIISCVEAHEEEAAVFTTPYYNTSWMDIWSGENIDDTNTNVTSSSVIPFTNNTNASHTVTIIEIALAYCRADIHWLAATLLADFGTPNYKIKITVLSKCGNHQNITNFSAMLANVALVTLIKMPNVGGCDLAFAHFMTRYTARETKETASNTIIFFLKDRNDGVVHQRGNRRNLSHMASLASRGQFVCGIKNFCYMSVWHDTELLKNFTMGAYIRAGGGVASGDQFNIQRYVNLGDFVDRELDWSFPKRYTKVCFGGNFAIPATRLFLDDAGHARAAIHRLEQLLLSTKSAMTLVEHFAERLWAALLTPPITEAEANVVSSMVNKFSMEVPSFMGALINCNIAPNCDPARNNSPHFRWCKGVP